MGQRPESDAALSHIKEKGTEWPGPYFIARAHAYRGETDAAFDWLEQSYRLKGQFNMPGIAVDPWLRSLHGDRRFEAILHKLKLDDWKRKVWAD